MYFYYTRTHLHAQSLTGQFLTWWIHVWLVSSRKLTGNGCHCRGPRSVLRNTSAKDSQDDCSQPFRHDGPHRIGRTARSAGPFTACAAAWCGPKASHEECQQRRGVGPLCLHHFNLGTQMVDFIWACVLFERPAFTTLVYSEMTPNAAMFGVLPILTLPIQIRFHRSLTLPPASRDMSRNSSQKEARFPKVLLQRILTCQN